MPVKPIPEGYHTVTPYLIVREAAKTIDFLRQAFGAEYVFEPMMRPDGKVMHTELKIGDSRVMISDASEQHPPLQCMIHLYVPDVDAVYKRAVAAGATSTMAPADQFYGDRGGAVQDPGGNHWYIATHVEDVEPAEMKKRAEAHMKKMQGKAA